MLSGGYGYLARPYGLSWTASSSAALVDPDGQLVRADAHQNTDLYWACRGRGGGSFAIATSFTVRLKKVANVIVFRVVWLGLSTKAAKSVMKAWQSWALQAPRRFNSNFVVAKGANGTINMHAAGQLVGTLAELQRELKELPNSRSVLIRRPAGRLKGETIPVRLTQEMITAIDKWIAAKRYLALRGNSSTDRTRSVEVAGGARDYFREGILSEVIIAPLPGTELMIHALDVRSRGPCASQRSLQCHRSPLPILAGDQKL